MNYIFLVQWALQFFIWISAHLFQATMHSKVVARELTVDSNFLVFTFRAFVAVYTHCRFFSNSWWQMYLKELLVALDAYAVKFIKLLWCYLGWFSAPCNILTVWCDILWLSIFLFCIPRQGNHMFPSCMLQYSQHSDELKCKHYMPCQSKRPKCLKELNTH